MNSCHEVMNYPNIDQTVGDVWCSQDLPELPKAPYTVCYIHLIVHTFKI